MQFPIVQRIDALADLGWRHQTHSKRRTGTMVFPCIRLRSDEARLMFPKLVDTKIPVRYLGWRWKDATRWEQIIPSTYHPFGTKDEEYLTQFLDQEYGASPSVERRVEELVIRGCWQKVYQNQQQREQNQQQEQEALSKLDAVPKSFLTLQQLHEPNPNPVSHNSRHDDNEDDDNNKSNNNDDDDDDGDQSLSPSAKRKRVVLRPGDIVEYYLPGRIFGNPDVLCQSKILGVTPKGAFPLNLESGDFLDPDQKVRRLAKVHKAVLVEDVEGVFRAVREFALRTAGTKELVGFHNKVRQIAQSRRDHTRSMDEFWQTKTEEGTKKSDKQSVSCITMSSLSTGKESKAVCNKNQPEWHQRLSKQLEQVEQNMKTKRRYSPRITPDELRLIMKIWSFLQKKHGQDLGPKQAIDTLVHELEMSEMRITAILYGDPEHKLSDQNKLEILEELRTWMKNKKEHDRD